jgi:transcriptional regulator with XRE-family HTH domain
MMRESMPDRPPSLLESAEDTAPTPTSFGQLLRARRRQQGLSLAQLATRLYFDKGHVSKVETDKRTPSMEFAQACDRVLDAGNNFETVAAAVSRTTLTVQWARQVADRGQVEDGTIRDALDSFVIKFGEEAALLVRELTAPHTPSA